MNKKLIILMGESGTGKDTIANALSRYYGLKILHSYTSRPQRNDADNLHIFIKPEEVDRYRNNMVAYTNFNGYEYFCTEQQLLNNDIYIIDPDGIEYLLWCIETKDINVDLTIFYIYTPTIIRLWRMYKRGDGIKKIISRYLNDRKKFATSQYDYKIKNNDSEMSAIRIMKINNK